MEEDVLLRRVTLRCQVVHRELGPGLAQGTYLAALTRELERAEIIFLRAAWFPVLYLDEEIDRVETDFALNNLLMEVRAKPALDREDVLQMLALLRFSSLPQGLLVNFGAEELQTRRITPGTRP